MIYIVHTKDKMNSKPPIKLLMYLEEVEAVDGHEACKKVRKEHPDREFIDHWEKKHKKSQF